MKFQVNATHTIAQKILTPTGEFDTVPSTREIVATNFPQLSSLLINTKSTKETGWNLGIQNIVQALYDSSLDSILPELTEVDRAKSISAIEKQDELTDMLLGKYPELKEVERRSQFGVGVFAAWLTLDAMVEDFNTSCEKEAAAAEGPIVEDRIDEDKPYKGEVTIGTPTGADEEVPAVNSGKKGTDEVLQTMSLGRLVQYYSQFEFIGDITMKAMASGEGTTANIRCSTTTLQQLCKVFKDFAYYSEYTHSIINWDEVYIGMDEQTVDSYFIIFPL